MSLSSYNSSMHSYTRAQIQEFRNAAATATNVPELAETRNSSGRTMSSRDSDRNGQEQEASIASHDFASDARRV